MTVKIFKEQTDILLIRRLTQSNQSNNGTMETTMVLYQKLWNFDLQSKKNIVDQIYNGNNYGNTPKQLKFLTNIKLKTIDLLWKNYCTMDKTLVLWK